MKIGISVYNMTGTALLELAVGAERLGFDAVYLGEHIVLPCEYASEHPTVEQSAYQHLTGPIISLDTELLDPWVALSAVAGATTRLRLATGMYILPLRQPLTTARAACTLQEISRGRFVLGVGTGWLREEFNALGVPFDERGRRVDETLEILQRAWCGGPFEYHGRHFDFGPVQVSPRPVDVPLMLGGNTEPALRRAAAIADAWFSSGTPSLDDSLRLRDRLHELRAKAGVTKPLSCHVRVRGRDPALLERYRAEGFDSGVIWADQLWPLDVAADDRYQVLSQVAASLGLARST